jgi:RNA polymerase sigma-70 factor (ECF subfamily)
MEDADEKLMLRYRDGDTKSFEMLYSRHKGPLYRYLTRQCGNTAVAEELFQDIWMNLINARDRYTVQAKFTTYLYRLAHNRLVDYYRKHSGSMPISYEDNDCPVVDDNATVSADNPERIASSQERITHLIQSIQELPEAQREAFLLHEESGLDLSEIAEITSVNIETAKSRLRYAFTKLRKAVWNES